MSKKRTKKRGQGTVTERVTKYLSESDKILKKYGLLFQLTVNYPRRRRVPILSRIALAIIRKQGGLLDIRFKDLRDLKQ